MKLKDCYLEAYCKGDRLSDKEVIEFLAVYKIAADALILLGPAFTIAFKEADNCLMWLDSMAVARKLK